MDEILFDNNYLNFTGFFINMGIIITTSGRILKYDLARFGPTFRGDKVFYSYHVGNITPCSFEYIQTLLKCAVNHLPPAAQLFRQDSGLLTLTAYFQHKAFVLNVSGNYVATSNFPCTYELVKIITDITNAFNHVRVDLCNLKKPPL